jgi:hypothetical protein
MPSGGSQRAHPVRDIAVPIDIRIVGMGLSFVIAVSRADLILRAPTFVRPSRRAAESARTGLVATVGLTAISGLAAIVMNEHQCGLPAAGAQFARFRAPSLCAHSDTA